MSQTKVPAVRIRVAISCPKCKGGLERISKRRFDRLLNAIIPVRRFKCYSCLWEGNRINEA